MAAVLVAGAGDSQAIMADTCHQHKCHYLLTEGTGEEGVTNGKLLLCFPGWNNKIVRCVGAACTCGEAEKSTRTITGFRGSSGNDRVVKASNN